ncbi:MAG TPA: iron-containing alcohol dehydrogenase [Pyrinomonadaceae bacterium]|jgi:alcohol dehydrogenase|nr:iron-containing alcohol dehydrogenase [Pyrinomonadaceae bacterium]
MTPFDFQPRTRVVFGEGAIKRLGELARELNFRRALLVADRGLLASGHVGEATNALARAGVVPVPFHDFDSDPDTRMCEAGRDFAAAHGVDSLVGLGGGSSMDCAKGVNFLLTNGGSMRDYQGYGKARRPLLPMIGVPTTAGTGSEAQSYALISDAETHVKMACGDGSAAFRVALLDPVLTVSQPREVTATAGFDALAHAVETFVTTRRNPLSDALAREAWRLLEDSYERVLARPHDAAARASMQLGASFAGAAIENSMLGATHACANPLTRRYGTTHGAALAALLPHVVRWNSAAVGGRYGELLRASGRDDAGDAGERLAARLEELAAAGGLGRSLRESGVPADDLEGLAAEASAQWTGTFNPRAFDRAAALELYRAAF